METQGTDRGYAVPGIVMPDLGYATGEGVILTWLKIQGDPVEAGDEVVEIAMEKTVHVVMAGRGGVLSAIYAGAGAIVPEGETIAWIGTGETGGEAPPDHVCRLVGWETEIAPAPANLAELLAAPASMQQGTAQQGATQEEAGRQSDPADLASASTAMAATAPLQSPGKMERDILRSQLRRVTSQRMAKSWVDSPKVDLFADVDFSWADAHRRECKERGGETPSYNIYIAHAVAKAFGDLPQFNIQRRGDEVVQLDSIDVGMAVALGDNLLTVSMKNLEGAGLLEIQRRFKGLLKKALRMSLHREELYASSLTVTNLGEFDISAFTAVINPPETFILAIGKVEDRAVVRDGQVTVAKMCTFCLSFDHRFIDGGPASRLLQRIKLHMEGEQGPL
jgi:pyruvate dehydrogenase E2 component (dihydrolipoamide acetyltransferase)